MDTITTRKEFNELVLSLGVETLLLRTRTINILKGNDIKTIQDLRNLVKGANAMKELGLGPVGRTEITSALNWHRVINQGDE